jgi:ABC-type branched-subunit amino acid transport system permease subunit
MTAISGRQGRWKYFPNPLTVFGIIDLGYTTFFAVGKYTSIVILEKVKIIALIERLIINIVGTHDNVGHSIADSQASIVKQWITA